MENVNFHIGPLIHDGEYYDLVNNNYLDDLSFYKKWGLKARGQVLELCCGTGRLTIPLRGLGMDISGLDINPSMLKKARQKAAEKKLKMNFYQGDIRHFDLPKTFSLIFIPFNSLQCIYSLPEIESVFAQIKKHLEIDGYFIFDIFNPSIHYMVEGQDCFVEKHRFHHPDGSSVVISEQIQYDAEHQIIRVKWHYQVGQEESIQNLDLRCFFPQEMQALLKYNHFKIIHQFGNFQDKPFVSSSPKQIFVCQKNLPLTS